MTWASMSGLPMLSCLKTVPPTESASGSIAGSGVAGLNGSKTASASTARSAGLAPVGVLPTGAVVLLEGSLVYLLLRVLYNRCLFSRHMKVE